MPVITFYASITTYFAYCSLYSQYDLKNNFGFARFIIAVFIPAQMHLGITPVFRLFIILVLTIQYGESRAGETLGAKPCDELDATNSKHDEKFLKKNLLHLHSDPIAFFEHDIPKECNLQFVDISKIDPPVDHSYTWITYLGDTVSYDLYAAAAQRLTGYNPAANIREIGLTKLGKHLGPQEDIKHEDVVGNVVKRPEYLVCCRANYHPSGDGNLEGSDSCVVGLNARSAMMSDEVLQKAKFYLFDNMSDYIRDVIELLYMGSYKCVSFVWAPDFLEAAKVVQTMNAAERYPSAVIMNMGIHTYTKEPKELDMHLKEIIKSTDLTPPEHETRYILHSSTSMTRRKNATNANELIKQFNERVKKYVPKWTSLDLYLDFWDYDVALSSIEGCKRKDGIHFERICNYQPMITQWYADFKH